jgi:hypothetical protein
MLEPIKGTASGPICRCCGAVARFQDGDRTLFYCTFCARLAAEKAVNIALKALLVILKARSPYLN